MNYPPTNKNNLHMIGLVFDTSGAYGSVTVIKEKKILCYNVNNSPNEQSETINLLIEKSLAEVGITYNDIDYLAVALGPGKFTSLRIGISVANAIFFATKKPLLPISNFEALAYNIKQTEFGVALKATTGKFYFQSFKNNMQNSEIRVINEKELLELKKDTHIIGDSDTVDEKFMIDARNIANCASDKIKNKTKFASNYLQPKYIINNYL
ncbi:MAG: tRNA threonylcarbamoyl adenosine modification protein YeaZ [Candidatus Midichloriaceae bacterium]|jgi:tRNA threonylcarbamoyl adenosine modification protein YeaZ